MAYPRAQLNDRGDIVKPDVADSSALSDVNALGRGRLDGMNGTKHANRDGAREHDKVERS